MLDETIPLRTVRAHCTDKPWKTPILKRWYKNKAESFYEREDTEVQKFTCKSQQADIQR
jgi:hypothetical protein